MSKKFILPSVLSLLGYACGGSSPTAVDPANPVEEMLISETARHAATLRVNVHAVITDHLDSNSQITSDGLTPLGWYNQGVAYFYRPMLHRASITPEPGKETATNLAAHEVCHAKFPDHKLGHWNCSASIATPTYPRPEMKS